MLSGHCGSYAHCLVSRWICISVCVVEHINLLSGFHSAILASFPDLCSGLFEISEPVRRPGNEASNTIYTSRLGTTFLNALERSPQKTRAEGG